MYKSLLRTGHGQSLLMQCLLKYMRLGLVQEEDLGGEQQTPRRALAGVEARAEAEH